MSTLQQIEGLLLPIWNRLYKENQDNIPKIFIKLMVEIIPKYSAQDLDYMNPKERNFIINILKNIQTELNKSKLLNKNENKILIDLIQLINKRKSVKEQIESYPEIGKYEVALVKDMGKSLIDDTTVRSKHSVSFKGQPGDFYIHNHPPNKGLIEKFMHIPTILDLIYDCQRLINQPNAKFVIIATNKENKAMGYFIYHPFYNKNFISLLNSNKINPDRLQNMAFELYSLSDTLFYMYYKRKLKKIGISYTYKTRAMPGYNWDDKDKIFKENQNENN